MAKAIAPVVMALLYHSEIEMAALVSARRAPIYKRVGATPQAVTVRVGASDGSWTEVAGDILEGDQVVIGSGRGAQ